MCNYLKTYLLLTREKNIYMEQKQKNLKRMYTKKFKNSKNI